VTWSCTKRRRQWSQTTSAPAGQGLHCPPRISSNWTRRRGVPSRRLDSQVAIPHVTRRANLRPTQCQLNRSSERAPTRGLSPGSPLGCTRSAARRGAPVPARDPSGRPSCATREPARHNDSADAVSATVASAEPSRFETSCRASSGASRRSWQSPRRLPANASTSRTRSVRNR
jgi:hypothetical protein